MTESETTPPQAEGRHPTPPRPVPKPGPARPAARPGHSAPAGSDPHRFGRVDPDGTVWLITPAGERVIGSWQGGDTEAAEAHFWRPYEDLCTEVDLLERRLESGTGDARKIRSSATALEEGLATAAGVGDGGPFAAPLSTTPEHADE